MTATNDSDRIIRAWLEAMPDEAPDRAVHAVLEAVETAPQRRAGLLGPWRDLPMPRLLFAGLAAILVVAVGAAFLGRTTSQSGIGTTPTPVPSAGPSASATPGPVASQVSDVPAVLRQDWEADVAVGDLPALGDHETQIQLSFGFDTPDQWVQTGFGPMSTDIQRSSASADGPDGVRLVSTEPSGGCALGDDAHYRWTITGNGLFLTLTAVSDPCASRRSTLERTWVHSLGARNLGGPGVLSDLGPNIQVTLPAANWAASGETGAVNVESDANAQFVAIKNPAGFSTPCSADGGRHVSEPSTIAGYTAYIQSMPGFHVTSTNATIGGKPAVHLAITTTPQSDCAAKLFEFAPNKLASSGGWFIRPGDPDTVWLVQVGKDLFLLQWLGNGVTLADEQSGLATVRFIDKLPAP